MKITKHAFKRAKERLGLGRKAFNRMCSRTMEIGKQHIDIKGNLHKWVTSIVMQKTYKPKVYLYSDFMLICLGDKVITVLKIPNNLLPLTRWK